MITKVFLSFQRIEFESNAERAVFKYKRKQHAKGRMQCRLNLSLLELQFSFPERMTDNSWKENGIFSTAKQELQIETSA